MNWKGQHKKSWSPFKKELNKHILHKLKIKGDAGCKIQTFIVKVYQKIVFTTFTKWANKLLVRDNFYKSIWNSTMSLISGSHVLNACVGIGI